MNLGWLYFGHGLGVTAELPYLGQTLTWLRFDGLALLFCVLFHLASFVGIVFSLHVHDRVQQVSALVYAGSAIAAVCAGDLITLKIKRRGNVEEIPVRLKAG